MQCLLAALLPLLGPARAPEPPPERAPEYPRHALAIDHMSLVGLNPARLYADLELGWRHRLYSRGGPLFDLANLGAYVSVRTSPALFMGGATVDVEPLSILRLRATYLLVQYYGVFLYPQSFVSPHADFSPQRLLEGRRAGATYPATGGRFELDLRVQTQIWRFVLRSEFSGLYQHFRLEGDDDLIYDIAIDALVPNHGWTLVDHTDLIYRHDLPRTRQLLLGARISVTKAIYPASVYERGEPTHDPNGPMLAVGPLFAFRVFSRAAAGRRGRVDEPTLFLLAQWNPLHRWRAGKVVIEDPGGDTHLRGVHAAMPTLVLGFLFNGILADEHGAN